MTQRALVPNLPSSTTLQPDMLSLSSIIGLGDKPIAFDKPTATHKLASETVLVLAYFFVVLSGSRISQLIFITDVRLLSTAYGLQFCNTRKHGGGMMRYSN